MYQAFRHWLRSHAIELKRSTDILIGRAAVLLLNLMRRAPTERIADATGALLRRIGPWLPEHRVGRANLRSAYPEKSDAEIEKILGGVWDNLGRVGAEFARIEQLWDYDPLDAGHAGRIEIPENSKEIFLRLRDDGKPALVFAAHLANWELPPLAAVAHGMPSAVVYRRPNLGAISETIVAFRTRSMGELIASGPTAPFKVSRALERGAHVGMLVDQHFGQGVDVIFFGRRCKANPLIARLARHFDCPIHGIRAIRLPGGRFRAEITEALEPARDAAGKVDVAATMQAITAVVEGWVREHPEQWLWLHRRWR
jgi:Kdo2-lipid IVA lauroyltransferase/acyltransferase